MSYATPFYYAAKAIDDNKAAHGHHPRHVKQRRRRIRFILFPALRAQSRHATVATATPSSSR